MLATAFFGLATALQIPVLTSLTSKNAKVPQGVAMGLSNSFISLGRVIGPLIGGYIFDINIFLPFLSGSVVMCIGFLVSLIGFRGAEKKSVLENDHLIS
jgi:DHA1 family multidrug resistance protein-like MFS transporter